MSKIFKWAWPTFCLITMLVLTWHQDVDPTHDCVWPFWSYVFGLVGVGSFVCLWLPTRWWHDL